MRSFAPIAIVIVGAVIVSAQRASDAQVAEAIQIGEHGAQTRYGASCLASPSMLQHMTTKANGRFVIDVVNHLGLIARAANEAKRLYKPLAVGDVTAAMRAPTLFVEAWPQETLVDTVTPIQQVLIRSKTTPSAHVVTDHLDWLQFPTTTLYRTTTRAPYEAHFAFDKVAALPAGDLEVVLVTEAGERWCKIGEKDRAKVLLSDK